MTLAICTRTGPSGQSRQLTAKRNLNNLPFDFLAGLLVDENYQAIRAVLVPVAVVWQMATYVCTIVAVIEDSPLGTPYKKTR
jgi:hypothetical protein